MVGYVADDRELTSQIRATAADAVIVHHSHPGASASFMPLLNTFPLLKVVAINANGRGGFLHELRPHSTAFAEIAADVLLSTLRGSLSPVIEAAPNEQPH